MVQGKVWSALVRAAAALLLALIIVTPAVAEIACADDSIMHLSGERATAGLDEQASVSDQGHENDERTPGQPGHCSFNHGHCSALPVGGTEGAQPVQTRISYASALASSGTLSVPETPERPPAS